MAQHDYNIANQTGLEFRQDLNNLLAAVISLNSGATAPSSTFAGMLWLDTSSSPPILKQRNQADDAWVTILTPQGIAVSGASTASDQRTALGLVIGTNVAGLSTSQNFTAPQRSALLTDNDGSFDLTAKQNFKCTTAADVTITFTNQADGLSGSVIFVNSGHVIAAHTNTKITTADLTKIQTSGVYRIDYLSDGTNAHCSVVGPYA